MVTEADGMKRQQAAAAHYPTRDLTGGLQAILEAAGLTDGTIAPEVLAPLDQFHVGGAAATTDLMAKLNLGPGARVLDLGSGLGGPARAIATAYACQVTGIDLNARFVEAANFLSRRTGLAEQVTCVHGEALDLPFGEAAFDAVVTQHAVMNIADRDALYAGVFRVLRAGGMFAMFDVVAGPEAGELIYPLPWAGVPADSHLLTAQATREVLQVAGFAIGVWQDVTEQAMVWNIAQIGAARNRPDALQPLALPLVMGADFLTMVGNLRHAIADGKLRVVQAIVTKPA